MAQARNFCFTLNNYTEDEYNNILEWECDYLVIGREKGQEGTEHLQGYVEFSGGKRITTLKKLNPRIHWETRRGTAKEAADYCKKDGDFFEIGELSQQGKRTDLEAIGTMLVEGATLRDVAVAHPSQFIRYHKGFQALREILMTDRTEKPYVEWRWGKAGVGKTRYCIDKHTSRYIKDGTMWWNGYTQQEAIIIDDFDGKWPYRDFLRIIDRYEYQGQTKGGYVKINSPFIYITCEYPPHQIWRGNELDQILRRIDLVVEVATEVCG